MTQHDNSFPRHMKFLHAELSGSGQARFSGWSPFSSRQWQPVWQEIRSLIRLHVSDRAVHQGVSGLFQALFGLALIAITGISGTGLLLLDK